MSVSPEQIAAHKRNSARALLDAGHITGDEYALIMRTLEPPSRARRWLSIALAVAGYGAVGLAAIVEAVAQVRPDLAGPLEQLKKLLDIIAEAL